MYEIRLRIVVCYPDSVVADDEFPYAFRVLSLSLSPFFCLFSSLPRRIFGQSQPTPSLLTACGSMSQKPNRDRPTMQLNLI